ncbi:MAG: TolC family protein [Opitutales bacterium]
MNRTKAFLFASALIHQLWADPDQNPSQQLWDPDSAVHYAITHNLELQAAWLQIERAAGLAEQGSLWSNPRLTAQVSDGELLSGSGERSFLVQLEQEFPLAGRLSKLREVGRIDVELARAEWMLQAWKMVHEVREHVLDLYRLYRESAALDSQRAVVTQVIDQLNGYVQKGEIAQTAVWAYQRQLGALSLEINSLFSSIEEAEHELGLLLGLPPEDKVSIDPTALPDPESLFVGANIEAILDIRPETRIARLAQTRSAARLVALHSATWDSVTLRVFLERDRSEDVPVGFENETFAGVGISINLPFQDPQRGALRAERAEKRAAQLKEAAVEQVIRHEWSHAGHASENEEKAWLIVQETLIPELDQQIATAQTLLARAELQPTELFDLQIERAGLKREAEIARAEWLASLNHLRFLSGGDLPKIQSIISTNSEL